MANKKFLLGILAMVLVFGMMVVGCDNSNAPNTDNGNSNTTDNGDSDTTDNGNSDTTDNGNSDKQYLGFNNYSSGSNWNTGSELKVKSLISPNVLKNNTTYIINISGTLDTPVKGFMAHFWQDEWTMIGMNYSYANTDIPQGSFDLTFYVTVFDDVEINQNTAFVSFMSNNEYPPEDIPQGTLMATISDFQISIIEEE